MRRNFKKSIAGALAGLMVLGSLQPLNVQAMEIDSSMIEEMEISNLGADEVTTTDVTYNFIDLAEAGIGWGTTTTVSEGGEITIEYSGQYAEVGFALPEGLDSSKIKKITANLTEGSAGTFSIKLYDAEKAAIDGAVVYGTTEMVPEVEFAAIGLILSFRKL
jgi:hypothetical protein